MNNNGTNNYNQPEKENVNLDNNKSNSAYSYSPYTSYSGANNTPSPKKEGRYGIGSIILCIILSAVISVATSLGIAFNSIKDKSIRIIQQWADSFIKQCKFTK